MGAGALGGGGCFCPMPLAWCSQLGTGFPKSCWKELDVATAGTASGSAANLYSNQLFPAGHCPGSTLSVAVPLQGAWYTPSTPELFLCQEKTSGTAGADGDSSHQLCSSGRCHRGGTDWLSILLQEQDFTGEGRQDKRTHEVQKCIRQLAQSQ